MNRLHLVGFTTDLKNLIFANRKGAKTGRYMLAVDDRLRRTLEEIHRREEEERINAARAAFPQKPENALVSKLSPKEIQALLREGKSEVQVAKLAETDVEWIERFTAPILAERGGVVDAVRAATLSKARLGPSGFPIGESVALNLEQRRVEMEPAEFEEAWSALRRHDRWIVSFRFRYRGSSRTARYGYRAETKEVEAINSVAAEMGWRPASPSRGQTRRSASPKPKKKSKTTARKTTARKTTARKTTARKTTARSKRR